MAQLFANPVQTWNERFAGPEYLFGTEPNAWLARHAGLLVAGGRALAVADGEGRNGVWLARQGMLVDAFDISPVGVAKAERLARQNQVQVNFRVCGVEDWDWQPERYDLVAAIFVQFADPATRAVLFRQMQETLKPGGLLLLQGYTPKQLEYKTGGPPLVEHLYTEELLRASFADMDVLELDCYEDDLKEGNHHLGRSALSGLVARKRAA